MPNKPHATARRQFGHFGMWERELRVTKILKLRRMENPPNDRPHALPNNALQPTRAAQPNREPEPSGSDPCG
jgi:hypothetical protein